MLPSHGLQCTGAARCDAQNLWVHQIRRASTLAEPPALLQSSIVGSFMHRSRCLTLLGLHDGRACCIYSIDDHRHRQLGLLMMIARSLIFISRVYILYTRVQLYLANTIQSCTTRPYTSSSSTAAAVPVPTACIRLNLYHRIL